MNIITATRHGADTVCSLQVLGGGLNCPQNLWRRPYLEKGSLLMWLRTLTRDHPGLKRTGSTVTGDLVRDQAEGAWVEAHRGHVKAEAGTEWRSHGDLTATRHWRRPGRPPSSSPPRNMALAMPWFWTPGLWSWERINICCFLSFKPPSLW